MQSRRLLPVRAPFEQTLFVRMSFAVVWQELLRKDCRASVLDEKCDTGPSSSAPQGSHWHYRVNHTDNRRCWFLSSEGMKVRSNARGAMSDVASQRHA
jgi:hypothetical protein